jgi:hypothetical protein
MWQERRGAQGSQQRRGCADLVCPVSTLPHSPARPLARLSARPPVCPPVATNIATGQVRSATVGASAGWTPTTTSRSMRRRSGILRPSDDQHHRPQTRPRAAETTRPQPGEHPRTPNDTTARRAATMAMQTHPAGSPRSQTAMHTWRPDRKETQPSTAPAATDQPCAPAALWAAARVCRPGLPREYLAPLPRPSGGRA